MPDAAFSLLLPVYHGDDPGFFRRAFESATGEQTLIPDEALIVRDGPVGPALEAALAQAAASTVTAVRVLRLPENVGLGRALDAGLAQCTHEIVARMDADDVCFPRRFARQVPLVATDYDIVGAAIVEFDRESDPSTGGILRVPPASPADIAARARFHSPFNHPSVVYRRSVVQGAGGYEDLPMLEDYWLFARMLAAGARAYNIPDPLLRYRVSAGSYSRRGGVKLFCSEIELQRRLRRIGFISRPTWLRNVVVRGMYRLTPEALRRPLYRTFVAHGA